MEGHAISASSFLAIDPGTLVERVGMYHINQKSSFSCTERLGHATVLKNGERRIDSQRYIAISFFFEKHKTSTMFSFSPRGRSLISTKSKCIFKRHVQQADKSMRR